MMDLTTETADTGEAAGATGTLNAVGAALEQVELDSDGEGGQGAIRLTLTEAQAVTNGLVEIRYDAAALRYEGMDSAIGSTALRLDPEAGLLVFDYATAHPIQAGSPLAILRFAYEGDYVNTKFQIRTLQRNEELCLDEIVEAPVTQEDGGHTYQLTASKDPTCTEEGENTYTCEKYGHNYTETVAALGHDLGPWETVKAADCFHDGEERRSCSRCGEGETRAVAAGTGPCPSAAFADLDTEGWYHPYTDAVIAKGLMQGTGHGYFQPERPTTRGMLVTTLYRLAGAPEPEGKSTFTDLRKNAYYEKAVAWAQASGIAEGVTGTTFCPDEAVTREQTATFLYRYVTEYLGLTPEQSGDLSGYSDSARISTYAREAVAWAVSESFLEGYGDGTLRPRANLTRAQMAKFLTILAQDF